jgi:hypothetical protein
MNVKSLSLFIFALTSSTAYAAIDLAEINKSLAGDGLVTEVHGSSPTQNLFLLTVRNPQNFFDFEHFSAYGKSATMTSNLLQLKRHDKIKVKGAIIESKSKQHHIEVDSFEIVSKYSHPQQPGDYEHQADIPTELLGKTSAEFLVHAVHKNGEVLVLEYKDSVVPVFVRPDQTLHTKDLARNDIIRMHYVIAQNPASPTHLKIAPQIAKPVEVLESIMLKHGKPADVTGALVLFPKSPQVSFDIYAIAEDAPFGLKRQYTLINFENPELFAKIRKLCEDAWKLAPNDFSNGRNKLVHNTIRFRAKGTFNQVDANQANVQILIKDIKDLELQTAK